MVGARGHEKRGCRWRGRINQTGVKINCKTLASRVVVLSASPSLSFSLSFSISLVACSRGFRALSVNRVTFLCVPRVPRVRSFRVRSLFLRARVARAAKGVRERVRADSSERHRESKREREREKRSVADERGGRGGGTSESRGREESQRRGCKVNTGGKARRRPASTNAGAGQRAWRPFGAGVAPSCHRDAAGSFWSTGAWNCWQKYPWTTRRPTMIAVSRGNVGQQHCRYRTFAYGGGQRKLSDSYAMNFGNFSPKNMHFTILPFAIFVR